jgi:dephospho-CoA kinase
VARTKVVGLTGGIASGKSTVARLLEALGAPVVDADRLARVVVEPGKPAWTEIVREFGRDILLPDGSIDRKKLGDIVFADEHKRRILGAITHPRIAAAAEEETARHAAAGEPIVIYEAALLVENGLHHLLDGLIVVDASPARQLERALLRDGITPDQARARIAAQLPLERKLAVATHVIDNSGTIEETRAQVERIWRELAGRS